MFTMKKFAVLAVAGFIASSTIACSDDDKGGDDDQSQSSGGIKLADGWDKSGDAVLGGADSDKGSFLDIDVYPFDVILKKDAASKKEDIDLVFDGTNFLTAEGCATADYCKTELANVDALTLLWDITAASAIKPTTTPAEFLEWFNSDDNTSLTESKVISKVAAKEGQKLFVWTDKDNVAIVFVGKPSKDVTLSIGRVAIPEDEEE